MGVRAITWNETGVTLYARGRRPSDDYIWNAATGAWEAENVVNVTHYTLQHDVFAVETPAGSYRYQVTIPGPNPSWAAGDYELEWYRRVGAAAAIADIYLLTTAFEWDGAAVVVNATKVRDANWKSILGTLLTESVPGFLAAAISKWGDVSTPVATALSVNQSGDCSAFIWLIRVTPSAEAPFDVKFAGVYDGLPYWVGTDAEERTVYLWGSTAQIDGDWDPGFYLSTMLGTADGKGYYHSDTLFGVAYADHAIDWYYDGIASVTALETLYLQMGLAVGNPAADVAAALAAAHGAGSWTTDPWSGDGDVAVDHDYDADGEGDPDQLRIVDGAGAGVDGATIRAYLQAEYDAALRSVKATAVTGSDGRWTAPMMLDAGDYYLVVSKPDRIATKVVEVTVA